MPIESTEGDGFVVTGEHIELYRLMTMQRALRLEIATGMKMTRGRSVNTIACQLLGLPKGTKKPVVLAHMDTLVEAWKASDGR